MKKFAYLLSVAILLTACNGKTEHNTNNQTSAPETVQNHELGQPYTNPSWVTYRVGSQLTYPPFHFQEKNGIPTGFEMEVLNEVARAGEFNVQVTNAPRSSLVETLNNNTFDIWSSTISIKPERLAEMDFSKPFLNNDTDVIYILDNEKNKNIQTLEDFKGKTISVNKHSQTAPDFAAKLTGSKAHVTITDSYYLSLKEVYLGKADGALDNQYVLANAVKQTTGESPKVRYIVAKEEQKDFAFAVKKGNNNILKKLNKGLDKIKTDGIYEKLLTKWFPEKP